MTGVGVDQCRLFGGTWRREDEDMKYGLLWLLGVPIPVLIVLYLLFN